MYSDANLDFIKVDLDDQEWAMVDACAAAEGIGRGAMLRRIILEQAEIELRDMDAVS